MSDTVFTVRVVGAAQLIRRLNALPDKVAKKLSKQALRAGAAVLRRHLRATIVKSDDEYFEYRGRKIKKTHLANTVTIWAQHPEIKNMPAVRLGYTGVSRFYGHLLESGTVHARPQPYWRQGVSEKASQIVRAVGLKLYKDLEKTEAKKR